MAYSITYTQDAREDLECLTRRNQVRVLAEVSRLLSDQPSAISTRCKQLESNPYEAEWELRLNDVRVLYDIAEGPEPTIHVLRVLEKRREQWLLRGQPVSMRS